MREWVVAVVLLGLGCAARVPTRDGGVCRVRTGEPKGDVAARCGPACAEGVLTEGPCAREFAGVEECVSSCAIYADRAVCFSSGEVVDVVEATKVTRASRAVPCMW